MNRARFEILALHVALLAFLFPMLALAQAAIDAPQIDPLAMVPAVLDAIRGGQWWVVASGVVSLLTWAVRSGILKRLPGAVGAFFTTSPIAGYCIPFVLSGLLAIFTTQANGAPFTVGVFVGELLKVGLGAVGLFIAKRTIDESRESGALAKTPLRKAADPVAAALDEMNRKA